MLDILKNKFEQTADTYNGNIKASCEYFFKGLEFSAEEVEEFLQEILLKQEFPKQTFGIGKFGFPAITLFRTDELRLDLYAWPKSHLSIHSHNFSGAFKVLGANVTHVQFNYKSKKDITETINLGELEIKSQDILRFGDTEFIDFEDKFIHFVFHHKQEGLTLVLRTNSIDEPLSVYLYPFLKIKKRDLLILKKKFELASFSLSQTTLSHFLKHLSDDDLFSSYVFNLIEDKEKLEVEIKKRKFGEKILEAYAKNNSFIRFLKITGVKNT